MPGAFRLDGAEAFQQSLRAFLRAAEHAANERVRGIAYSITFNLVMETPQYSGAAASAWRVGIGTPEIVTEKPRFPVPGEGPGVGDKPYSKRNRNMAAVNEALALCSLEIGMFGLQHGSLYISNGLDYTKWFEQGQHAPGKALRMANLPQRKVHEVVMDSMNAASVLRF